MAFRFLPQLFVILSYAACVAAGASLISAAALPDHAGRGRISPRGHRRRARRVLAIALMWGASAGVIHALFLVIRLVQIGIEIVVGYARDGASDYGFGHWGLWSNSALLAACSISGARTRDRRLFTCGLWLAVTLVVWAFALIPPTRLTSTGAFERTGSILLLISALASVLGLAALAMSRWRWCPGTPDPGRPPCPPSLPPGAAVTIAILSGALALLSWYQLLVPWQLAGGGFRLATLGVIASLMLAALACFLLLETGGWRPALADAFVALASMAQVGVFVLAVPSKPDQLAERYPLIFNALILGLAFAAAVCGHASITLANQPGLGGLLAGPCRRFVFFNAVVAFVLAVMMTVWPRVPGISAMDDSFGRVIAGFAANLTLLLVMLWVSRKIRRLTLHILTVLVLGSTLGFLAARVLPFASHVN